MRGRGALLLTICLVFGLVAVQAPGNAAAACAKDAKGGNWTGFGGDVSNSRTQDSEKKIGPAEAPHLEPAWAFSTTAAGLVGNFQSTPAIADGCLYVGTSSGWIAALNADTGKLVWKVDTGASGTVAGGIFGVTVAEGKAFAIVSAAKGPYVIALDQKTGKRLWVTKTLDKTAGAWSNASAVYYKGMVLAGMSGAEGDVNARGSFHVLDAQTGKRLAKTYVVPDKAFKKGYAGGGIWSTAAVDSGTDYAFVGAGNPYGPKEYKWTNAILKIDVRRGRSTFGKIVGSYKGNVDQYYSEASALAETPACKNDVLPGSVDYPQCGQIDLDFGASPNLFRDSEGRLIVGVLQKSGVYHAAYTSNMKGAWTALVGAPCALCNASTSAYDGTKIYVAGTPGGQMLALNKDDGSIAWVSPEGDGAHYQPISTANGVVYSVSTRATLDSYDAELGVPVFSRPMPADTGDICEALSGGVAIARGRVYAPCDLGVSGGGWIVSYSYDAD